MKTDSQVKAKVLLFFKKVVQDVLPNKIGVEGIVDHFGSAKLQIKTDRSMLGKTTSGPLENLTWFFNLGSSPSSHTCTPDLSEAWLRRVLWHFEKETRAMFLGFLILNRSHVNYSRIRFPWNPPEGKREDKGAGALLAKEIRGNEWLKKYDHCLGGGGWKNGSRKVFARLFNLWESHCQCVKNGEKSIVKTPNSIPCVDNMIFF